MLASPPLKLKIFFWIILGMLSTFFAEVVSASALFPFTTGVGIFLVFPVYFLHTIVLATIVFRYSRPRLPTLFLGGMLFGMYEAYMTKVLWASFLEEGPAILFGGVAVIETLILVFFWHAVLAFILPVLLGETLLTKSREGVTGLPLKIKKWSGRAWMVFLVLIFVIFGISQGLNAPAWQTTFASGIIASVLIIVFSYLFRERFHGNKFSMRELLPTKKQFGVLVGLLLLFYIFLGVTLNPEKLPGIKAQSTVWSMYVVLIYLILKSLKKSKARKADEVVLPIKFSWKRIIGIAMLFTVAGTLSTAFLAPYNAIIILPVFLAAMLLGIIFFLCALRDTFRKSQPL